MDHFSSLFVRLLLLLSTSTAAFGSTFTFVNKCQYTVWPGILANAGSPRLDSTGFELPPDSSRSFQAPTGWSGRFWARTSCSFDDSGSGSCLTGDCGSGQVECNGLGAAPPATLAEFTLGSGGQDFYDVSLVDGYNLPMIVEGSGGSGMCASTGCSADLNTGCPEELRVGEGSACKSACEAFGSPEYCCSGAFNTPATCRPSVYSEMFKSACPRSYSYAYDDATSTFTCTGADYTVTFCPSSPSQKSSSYTAPVTATTTTSTPAESGVEYSGTSSGYNTGTGTEGGGSGEAMLADGSWLAGLAMGHSSPLQYLQPQHFDFGFARKAAKIPSFQIVTVERPPPKIPSPPVFRYLIYTSNDVFFLLFLISRSHSRDYRVVSYFFRCRERQINIDD